jgi:hypothetical protein
MGISELQNCGARVGITQRGEPVGDRESRRFSEGDGKMSCQAPRRRELADEIVSTTACSPVSA